MRSNTLHIGKKGQLEYGVLELKVPCLLAFRLVYTSYSEEALLQGEEGSDKNDGILFL